MSVWLGMTSPECVCSSCKYPKKRTTEAHISYSITVSQLSMAESIAQAAQTLGTTAPALAFFLAQSRDTGLSTKLHSYTRASCLQVESSLRQPDADFWLSLIGITPHGMNRRLHLSASLVLPAPVTLQHGKCDVSLVEQLPRSLHADKFESQRLSLPGGAHSLSFLPKCEHPNTLMPSFFFFPNASDVCRYARLWRPDRRRTGFHLQRVTHHSALSVRVRKNFISRQCCSFSRR